MTKISAILAAALLAISCGANPGILNSGKETPVPFNAAPLKAPAEKEVDAMRTAGFSMIYVIKRRDGAKLESEDRAAIKEQTVDANRRVATEDGLAVVVGTNTPPPIGRFKLLLGKFLVDNYSQLPSEAPVSSPSNSNK
jgi:hypothetical protein